MAQLPSCPAAQRNSVSVSAQGIVSASWVVENEASIQAVRSATTAARALVSARCPASGAP
ncbi:hypothetical protein ACWC5I_04365 [Kitasatospora sp. NPDC001574]